MARPRHGGGGGAWGILGEVGIRCAPLLDGLCGRLSGPLVRSGAGVPGGGNANVRPRSFFLSERR